MNKLRKWLSSVLSNKKLQAFLQGVGSILQLFPKKKFTTNPKVNAPKQAIEKACGEVGRSLEGAALIALNERTMAEGLPRLRDELARMREKGIIDENGNRISMAPIDDRLLEHDCDV